MLLECILWIKSVGVSESESYVMTNGQSGSLSWNKAPIWGLWPDFYYCQTIAGLLMCGALSDERMDLSFIIAAGPRQHSHFWVRGPWDSWPYYTVSDLRLPFSLPRTTPIPFYHSRQPGYETPPWRILCFVSAATVCLSTRCHRNTCSSTATNIPRRALSCRCMYSNSVVTCCHGNMLC
jgi:hypothetical protein